MNSGTRFRKAYYDVNTLLQARIFRLASETNYEIVATTVLPGDLTPLGYGILSTENATITFPEASEFPSDTTFFEFEVRFIFVDIVLLQYTPRLILVLFCRAISSNSTRLIMIQENISIITNGRYQLMVQRWLQTWSFYQTTKPMFM